MELNSLSLQSKWKCRAIFQNKLFHIIEKYSICKSSTPCPSTKMQLSCHQPKLGHDFQHKLHIFPATFCLWVCELYHSFSSLHLSSYMKKDMAEITHGFLFTRLTNNKNEWPWPMEMQRPEGFLVIWITICDQRDTIWCWLQLTNKM